MKTCEIVLAHGPIVWIDGEGGKGGWQYVLSGSNKIDCTNLSIGGHKIEQIEITGPEGDNSSAEAMHIFSGYIIPKHMTVVTVDKTYSGPITRVVTNPDDSKNKRIKLVNGKMYQIDEISLYLKAKLA